MDDFLKNDDTFLARWSAGALSAEELKLFEQHPDYDYYRQLLESTDTLKVEKVNADRLLENIKAQRSIKDEKPVKKLNRRYLLMAAATLLFLIIGYQVFFKTSQSIHETSFGEQLADILPDGSKFTLNANSSLTFEKNNFSKNRHLNLEGEAFFEVKKGSTFSVHTNNGIVEVLGTSFTVYSKDAILKVACKTGKVKVTNPTGTSELLEPGERIFSIDGQMNNKEIVNAGFIGNWKEGASRFEKEPLDMVVKALEDQYKITIELKTKISDDSYSGGFGHDNLEEALQSVFTPMGLKYTEKQKGNYIVE